MGSSRVRDSAELPKNAKSLAILVNDGITRMFCGRFGVVIVLDRLQETQFLRAVKEWYWRGAERGVKAFSAH